MGISYELFLDEHGHKISKSRGNGLTVAQWLRYAPAASLRYFMYVKPKAAKRLHFDVIPAMVDEYTRFCAEFARMRDGLVQDGVRQDRVMPYGDNPVFHVHAGAPPVIAEVETRISYTMLLNLVSACNGGEEAVLWGFIERYNPGAHPHGCPWLAQLVRCALHYFADFVAPRKSFALADARGIEALAALDEELARVPQALRQDGEAIQNILYATGKEYGYTPLRDWFALLYRCLLGQESGPRFGSFIAIYGIEETQELIAQARARSRDAQAE